MFLPDPAEQRRFAGDVVRQLRAQGFQALWAGGCVRDKLLGRTPKDYDVVTDAQPEQIRHVFGTRRTLAIGAAFGVITVLGSKAAGQVEVTTFRRDAEYRDGRHPEGVVFSSPQEDAARRDFTINGMFFDPLAEQLIDYVGGAEDLGRRIVRAIGNPRARFAEDKLRMLRAVRFTALFDFELDEATLAAIVDMSDEVTVVSAERITAEMQLMLVSPRRARALQLLHRSRLLAAILPEIAALADEAASEGDSSSGAVTSGAVTSGAVTSGAVTSGAVTSGAVANTWRQTLAILEALDADHGEGPAFALALAAVLHGIGDPRFAVILGRRWKLARKDFERVEWLLENRAVLSIAGKLPWSQLQPVLVHEGIGELLALGTALVVAGLLDPAALEYCRGLVAMPAAKLNPPPLVTGQDLIALGIPRGNVYARLLREVRAAQLDERIADKEQALALVKQLLDAWDIAS
jgi:tRNA nucleotidyltransferase/poly(A) polymerase